MIELLEVKKSCNKALREAFPKLKIYGTDVREGMDLPSFYTEIIPYTLNYESINLVRQKCGYKITLLEKTPNEEFQKETNQLKYERKGLDNILWYVNLYRNFSNDQRNLTKDKLKDIIKLISQLSHINSNPTDLTIIDFGQVFGNQSSIENVILNTLTKYSETRNKLAHGSELSEEERDFRHLYSNLIIVFAAFIEYLNGKILY